MEIKLVGTEALKKALASLTKRYPLAAGAALYQEGFALQANATKLAPLQYGVLRSSAYTGPPTETKGNVSVQVGFGTVYAERQHEETTWRHTHGQAKYLEAAVNVLRVGYLKRLGDRIQQNVEQGVDAAAISGNTSSRPNYALRRKSIAASKKKALAVKRAQKRRK